MKVDVETSRDRRSAARVPKVALLNRNPSDRLRRGKPTKLTVPGALAKPTFKNANGPRGRGVAASRLPQNVDAEREAAPRPATVDSRNRPTAHDPRTSASERTSVGEDVQPPGTVSTRTAVESDATMWAGIATRLVE
jgi:hypothetical protein